MYVVCMYSDLRVSGNSVLKSSSLFVRVFLLHVCYHFHGFVSIQVVRLVSLLFTDTAQLNMGDLYNPSSIYEVKNHSLCLVDHNPGDYPTCITINTFI